MSTNRLTLRSRPARLLVLTVGLAAAWVLVAGAPGLQGAPQQGTLPWKPAAGTEDQYVGSENCLVCHDIMAESYAANPHQGSTAAAGLPVQDASCEACHGPGLAHMDAGGDPELLRSRFTVMDAAATGQACLTCHAASRAHASALTSQHAASEVSCTSCHSVHHARADVLMKAATPQLCYTCHRGVEASFKAPEGHGLEEGLISCESCHNPHGSVESPMLARSMVNGELCATCHIDKRGPFVFEHPAASVEGCVACHTPHGSANRFMLKANSQRELCISCHISVPTFHDISSPRYQDCTTCHASIHGSDTHRLFFRR